MDAAVYELADLVLDFASEHGLTHEQALEQVRQAVIHQAEEA